MESTIDDAFNWLVLILSTISGVLTGLPETMEVKKSVAFSLIPPSLVLVVIWLFSNLTGRTSLQVILKSYAWFYSSFMFLLLMFIFAYVTSPVFVSLFFGPAPPFGWVIVVMAISFFVVPFLFYVIAVQPKYRQIHRDSKFLAGRLQPALLYVMAIMTFILLMGVFMTGEKGILRLLL